MSQNTIPTDAPVTLDVVKSLSTLDQQAIVRPNNPPSGIAGFLFDVDLNQQAELTSDVTDHYVEANYAIQDHIALRPEVVVLRGLVSELKYANPNTVAFNPPANPLPPNLTLLPQKSPGALNNQINALASNAINAGAAALFNGTSIQNSVSRSLRSEIANLAATTKSQLSQTAQSAVRTLLDPSNLAALSAGGSLPLPAQQAVNLLRGSVPSTYSPILQSLQSLSNPTSQQLLTGSTFTSFGTSDPGSSLFSVYNAKQPTPQDQTKQGSAFLYFYNLWKSRSLFSVETPWGIYTNMVISSLRAEQPEETKDYTDFTVTFKKIRIAQELTISTGPLLAGRLEAQNDVGSTASKTPTQAGLQTTNVSWLKYMSQFFAPTK